MLALSEDERAELLGHLKAKWAQLNTAFQKLPFMVDTPAKVRREGGRLMQSEQARSCGYCTCGCRRAEGQQLGSSLRAAAACSVWQQRCGRLAAA